MTGLPHDVETGCPHVSLVQGPLTAAAACGDCGRPLRRGCDALHDEPGDEVLCLTCVSLDTVHSVGMARSGARRGHVTRLDDEQATVHTHHPRLGPVTLELNDDPQHVRDWLAGARGAQMFGRKLSRHANEHLKVLHNLELPGTAGAIDHIAVTADTIWVLDERCYVGKVETRGHGPLSRRPRELLVNGRNQTKLIIGVKRQAAAIQQLIDTFTAGLGLPAPPHVRGALVFVNGSFGRSSPLAADGVWVGWETALSAELSAELPAASATTCDGALLLGTVTKQLARALHAR